MIDPARHYLSEMEIDLYELRCPEFFSPVHKEAIHKEVVYREAVHGEAVHREAVHREAIELSNEHKLLLVSPSLPSAKEVTLFARVLASIGLELYQACHLYPHQVGLIQSHTLSWIWYAGCEMKDSLSINRLTSPMLSQIEGNNHARRALWQQIQTYQTQ